MAVTVTVDSPVTPGDYNRAALDTLLDQVIAWSTALASLRQPTATAPAMPPAAWTH